jgi:hypothetical protein
MLLETWSSDFKGFVEGLAAALAEKDEIPIDEARREIKQNYRSFIAPHLVYYLSGSYLPGAVPPRSVRLGRKIMPYMGPVGSALRKLYLSGQKKVKGRPESQYIPATQLSESDNDFKLIHDFLSTPPHSIRCPAPNTVKRQLEV